MKKGKKIKITVSVLSVALIAIGIVFAVIFSKADKYDTKTLISNEQYLNKRQ